jgi:CO/xanthine dehydrogenase FAD-binding subunit
MADVIFPNTIDEFIDLKAASDSTFILAGGTDLLVRLRKKFINPQILICLDHLTDTCLFKITDSENEIHIGAAVTHAQVIKNPLVEQHANVLIQALKNIGSPQIRNMGTLGGNIMTASPAGDSLPPLYILDAKVELAGKNGTRRMPVSKFITGPGTTCLNPEEILHKVIIPKSLVFDFHYFEKVGHRKSLSIAIVSMAALIETAQDGIVKQICLAWGSIGKTVVTSPAAEAILSGSSLDHEVLSRAAEQVRKEISPISDVRAGAEYRRQVAGNLLMRLYRPQGTKN